jgi:hypothetical protein
MSKTRNRVLALAAVLILILLGAILGLNASQGTSSPFSGLRVLVHSTPTVTPSSGPRLPFYTPGPGGPSDPGVGGVLGLQPSDGNYLEMKLLAYTASAKVVGAPRAGETYVAANYSVTYDAPSTQTLTVDLADYSFEQDYEGGDNAAVFGVQMANGDPVLAAGQSVLNGGQTVTGWVVYSIQTGRIAKFVSLRPFGPGASSYRWKVLPKGLTS